MTRPTPAPAKTAPATTGRDEGAPERHPTSRRSPRLNIANTGNGRRDPGTAIPTTLRHHTVPRGGARTLLPEPPVPATGDGAALTVRGSDTVRAADRRRAALATGSEAVTVAADAPPLIAFTKPPKPPKGTPVAPIPEKIFPGALTDTTAVATSGKVQASTTTREANPTTVNTEVNADVNATSEKRSTNRPTSTTTTSQTVNIERSDEPYTLAQQAVLTLFTPGLGDVYVSGDRGGDPRVMSTRATVEDAGKAAH